MPKISRQRLEFATLNFLAEMRKRFVMINPGEEVPIQPLADYAPADRSALMAGIEKAIIYAGVDGDPAFEAWQRKQEEEKSSQ